MVNGPRLTWIFSFPFHCDHPTSHTWLFELPEGGLQLFTERTDPPRSKSSFRHILPSISNQIIESLNQHPSTSTSLSTSPSAYHSPLHHHEHITPSTPALLQTTWNWRATSDASQRTPPLLFSLTMPTGSQQAIESHTGYPKTVYTWFHDKYYISSGLFRDTSLGEKHEGVQISSFLFFDFIFISSLLHPFRFHCHVILSKKK